MWDVRPGSAQHDLEQHISDLLRSQPPHEGGGGSLTLPSSALMLRLPPGSTPEHVADVARNALMQLLPALRSLDVARDVQARTSCGEA